MKAPDKIYLSNYSSGVTYNWHDERLAVKDIEYICADAFIEKVENYLNSKLYDWVNITNPDQRSCANVIPKEDFIDDFRNYMKGE